MSGVFSAHTWAWLVSLGGSPSAATPSATQASVKRADPVSETGPVDKTSPDTETEAVLAHLREAIRRCNVQSDDPNMSIITAFAHAIRHLGARTAASDQVAKEASKAILDGLLQAKQTTDAEIDRFRIGLAATEADTIQRIGSAIAQSADKALARRVRVLDRNTAMLAALAFLIVSVTNFGAGYWQGGKATYADVHAVQQNLVGLFGEKLADTKAMLNLLKWNPIVSALSQCERTGRTGVQNGRRYCNVLLWTENATSVVEP